MRVRLALALLVTAALPAIALAQPGRGGRGNDNKADKYKPTNDMPEYPAAAVIQKYNPVVYLIDRKKKLSLSDSQVNVLRVLQGQIYERNGDLLAQYDSIQRIYKPVNANDASDLAADSAHTQALQQTKLMGSILDSLMTRRQKDDTDALGLLADEKQKKNAADLLDKQDGDFAKLIPAGAVPGGGGRKRRP